MGYKPVEKYKQQNIKERVMNNKERVESLFKEYQKNMISILKMSFM